jgi:hypothetical protein
MPMSVESVDQSALAELLERAEIFDLLRLERFWRDQGEWEKLADCYTEDARVRTTWFDGTAAEFVEASRKMAERGRHSKHMITPTYLRIREDRALAESLGEIHNRSTLDGVEVDMIQYCRFFSRLRRSRAGWRLASFEGIYQRDTIHPVNPGEQLTLDWDALSAFRPSYRIWSYALSRQGYEVPQDRVADDRRDLLESFYAAQERWLEAGQDR